MRQHGHAARGAHQRDSVARIDTRPGNEGRFAAADIAGEGVREVRGIPSFDQGPPEMRPPYRAMTGDLPHALQSDRRADPAETLDHALHPLGARAGIPGELLQ